MQSVMTPHYNARWESFSNSHFPELEVVENGTLPYEYKKSLVGAIILYHNCHVEWDGSSRLRFYSENDVYGLDIEHGVVTLLPRTNLQVARMALLLFNGKKLQVERSQLTGLGYAIKLAQRHISPKKYHAPVVLDFDSTLESLDQN